MENGKTTEFEFCLTKEQQRKVREHIRHTNELFTEPWFLIFASLKPYFMRKPPNKEQA